MAVRAGLENPFLEVAVSKPILGKFFLNRGLFLSFLISLYKAALFSRLFAKCSREWLRSAASPLCKFCSDSIFLLFCF